MENKQSNFLGNYRFELISSIVLLVFFSPILFYANEVKYLIHDNMDGLVPLYKFMGQSEVFWASSSTQISGIMDTLPRACLPSVFSFFRILFLLFPAGTAYAIHYIFQHIIAFVGMRIFIKSYINSDSKVYNLVALAFACLPYWPGGELTVAGLPLLTWAMLRIFSNQSNFGHWTIIILFPFFSSLTFGNMFTFPMLFVMLMVLILLTKTYQFKWIYLLPFVLIGCTTIISEWNMFALFAEGFKSNRIENLGETMHLNFKGILGVSFLAFLFGHYHFHSYHLPIILIGTALLFYALFKRDKSTLRILIIGFISIGLMYFLTVFLNNVVLLKNFNFSVRFWALMPVLWYLLFAYALIRLKNNFLKISALSLQVFWVIFMIYPKDYYGSVYAENVLYYNVINSNDQDHQSFNSYYRIKTFDKILATYPQIHQENVVSIGLNPGIALFNQFKTFDAYLNLYPLEKWQSIKTINAKEYTKANLTYYSNNRAYLFSSDIQNGTELRPEWDIEEMKRNHISYILSSKPIIGNYQLIGSIDNIYIYNVSTK